MKNKKLIRSLIVMVFVLMFLGSISNSRNINISPEISQGEIEDKLIPVNFSINIGNIYPDWNYYINNYNWCSGNGTELDLNNRINL
ncbi:hypothetical protein LCGC14_1124490 [marine sediment metagenome]|uniref:Uncharacterized protein n=1 Tax=marine sediment metagenome TaxID=412755 RepID=A0A0F9MQU4_9ZZZZ